LCGWRERSTLPASTLFHRLRGLNDRSFRIEGIISSNLQYHGAILSTLHLNGGDILRFVLRELNAKREHAGIAIRDRMHMHEINLSIGIEVEVVDAVLRGVQRLHETIKVLGLAKELQCACQVEVVAGHAGAIVGQLSRRERCGPRQQREEQ